MFWRIYYSDGTTFNCHDGAPADAPRENVQVILQGKGDNSRVLWKSECYCWELNQWVEHDRFYADQYVSRCYHPIRLNGCTLPPEKFRPILDRAIADKRAEA